MDADATSVLHKKGVSATDDSYKFIWFQVSVCVIDYLESYVYGVIEWDLVHKSVKKAI